ncbi:hypothetical protein OAQ57_01245 [Candidatus Marinimicrobia bacterium]|nr:hypothetical protein [Candidatus Neomarinimicrobiota bacterium]
MKNIIAKTLLLFSLFVGCSSGPYTTTDDFSGITFHRGNISSSSGLIGGLLILKAERQVTTEMKESFLIRLEFHHTDWLFIESVTFKNIKENWEKSFEWKSYDVNTDVIGGGRITEKIVIMLSKEELTELLSQSNFDVRLYGKNYYKNFPFPKEKMTTWKQFLNTKMN